MPEFKTLEGDVLAYGEEGAYNISDEKSFTLSLDKQVRAVNLQDSKQLSAVQFNLNQISKILNLDPLPENGVLDEPTMAAIHYFTQNSDLFREHGISEHINAKKLEKITNPAFTKTEHAPTIEEMKALEIDIGKLYDQI